MHKEFTVTFAEARHDELKEDGGAATQPGQNDEMPR